MGIQINGNNDIISALDGSWTAEGASINTSGILTATTFKGNIVGTAATFTGPVTIGGTLTYEDVTNIDSVGIITARNGIDCNGTLEVSSTSNFDGTVKVAGDIEHLGDDDTKIVFTDNKIQFNTAGTNYLKLHRYASVNFVEVGASASISLANNGANARAILIGDGDHTSTGRILMQAGAGSQGHGGAVTLYSHANSTNAGGVYIGKSLNSSGSIIFGNGGTSPNSEYVRITSAGRIGIGTAIPGNLFEVVGGDSRFFNADKSKQALIAEGRLELIRDDSFAYIDFATTSAEDFDCRIQQSSNGLRFYTGGNGSTDERLRIASDGNVTIGKDGDSGSNPSAGYDELCIEGGNEDIGMCFLSPAANTVKHQISFGDSNNNQAGRIIYDHDGDYMSLYTGNGERLHIASNGNVHIGSGNPTVAKLQVSGAGFFGSANTTKTNDGVIIERNSSDGYAHITAGRSGGNYSGFNYYVAGASGVTLRHQIDYQSNFKWFGADGTTERLRIDSSGRIGIDYTPGSGDGPFNIDVTGSNNIFHLGHGTNDDNYYTTGASGTQYFRTPSANQLVIKSDGYAEFAGANDLRLTLGSTGTAGTNTANWLRASGADLMYNAASGSHIWEIGGSEKLRITTTALLPGTDNNLNLGSSSKRWQNIYTGDLQLSNVSGSTDQNGESITPVGNEVDNTQGTWTIQEGLNDLFLINRINGKKYKFNLTEVS